MRLYCLVKLRPGGLWTKVDSVGFYNGSNSLQDDGVLTDKEKQDGVFTALLFQCGGNTFSEAQARCADVLISQNYQFGGELLDFVRAQDLAAVQRAIMRKNESQTQ